MDIGSVLHDRYTLTARLGKGAMGMVYRADDKQTGQTVAVKVIARDLAFEPDMLERFRREGEALRQLRHPNIVGFIDMFQHEDQQVIIMEYVPGGSLFQLIKQGPLPVDRARRIALELCDALTRAHHLNIIHRDIKPENVLLADDGTPRLTDFGVARLIGEGTRLTGTGTQVGTPYYMSPEAWQGQPLDGQTDIWSLGVVLYEMLANQVPFGGETMVAVMNKVLTAPLPDIRAVRTDLPDPLVKVIRKMLTRDKAKRYQTIREVALDLERVSVPASATVVAAPATVVAAPATVLAAPASAAKPASLPQVRGPAQTSRTLWIGGGLVAACLCLAAAFGLFALQPRLAAMLGAPAVSTVTSAAPTQPPSPTSRPQPSDTLLPAATQPPPPTSPPAVPKLKVGLVIDVGGVNDKSFDQGAWEGAQKAAQEFGFDAQYLQAKQPADYETIIDQFAAQGYGVIVTTDYLMGDATAAKARQYPNIKFAIVDNAYFPTQGSAACPDTVKDCYSDGGLKNVTSLMFQEDEAGFLAGVVAAGMTKTGTVCTAAGIEIPPVVRYVTGYQNGAKWMKPGIKTLNAYIQSFTDTEKGRATALSLIAQGCDVVFQVAGGAGNEALLAAKEKGLMAIGVDSDEYNTYPDVKDALLTSAVKNVDVAVYGYLKAVSAQAGIITATAKNGGVGLAPYHDWDSKIPDAVKAKVAQAIDGFTNGTLTTSGGGALQLAILAPLTGSVPTFGISTRNGALLAIQEWNAKGGLLGKQIVADVADSQCSANPARNAANKVIDQDGVHYIIGEVCSSASIPVSQIAEARHVVQISPTSTNPNVTLNADGSTKQYVFRACFIDPFQGKVMAQFALSKGYKTVLVMLDPSNDYVRRLAEAFSTEFQKGSGQVVGKETYTSSDTDFSAILAKVADSKAEVLYVPDYYNIVNLVGQQARAKGLTTVMMGGDGWDSAELDLKAVDGGFYSNHYDPSDASPAVTNWIQTYGAAYKDAQGNPINPDALATLAYDATNLMLTAIQNTGVDDPVKVKDTLAGMTFHGVTGGLSFDAQHDPIKSAVIVGIKNGSKTYVTTINP